MTEYLPYARSTHQRSPDEAVHEVQIDCEEAGSGRASGDQLTHRVSHRERPPITIADAAATRSAATRSTGRDF